MPCKALGYIPGVDRVNYVGWGGGLRGRVASGNYSNQERIVKTALQVAFHPHPCLKQHGFQLAIHHRVFVQWNGGEQVVNKVIFHAGG